MNQTKASTLTARVAAVQFKMLHIHFRAIKIHEEQERLNQQTFIDNRDKIKRMRNAAYSCIDMIISMEHIVEVINDLLATPELRNKFDRDVYVVLNASKKAAEQWKPVRNRIGGHVCIEAIEEFCDKHNYRGVFLSDDLETDLGPLNILAIESALNLARQSCDIFKRDLCLMEEMQLFVERLNQDWGVALAYFEPTMEFLYRVGKTEKFTAAQADDVKGIVIGS